MFFTFFPHSFMNICWYHHPLIDSTNTWAKGQQEGFNRNELTVITADMQTKGRGRQGKPWLSEEKNNSSLSVAFFWPTVALQPFAFSQIVSLCVVDLLQMYGIDAQIKWPNDLLVNGKKIAGILVEIEPLEDLSYIVIGCGLNINMSLQTLENLPKKATSMFAETGKLFDIKTIQAEFISLFIKKIQESKEQGFEKFASLWHQKVQWMISQHAIVQTLLTKAEGTISEITSEGNLFLEISPGKIIPIHSGEIFC